MSNHDLIREIDGYCAQAGISRTTFGRLVGQGGRFYARLEEGRRNWPETIEKVRAYMRNNPPENQRVKYPTQNGAKSIGRSAIN